MARRKHGEGTVFQRKDGRWVAQVRLDNGKQKQRYFKPDQEKEAHKALRKMLHEKEQGTLATGPNQTLKAYLEQWLEQRYKLGIIRASTYSMHQMRIHKHIVPLLGHIQLQKLTPQQLQALYTKKLDEGLSPATVRNLHAILHGALDQAVKWNLVSRNVCDVVTVPASQRHETQPLTFEQAQRLLDVAHEHRLETLLIVAVATGMRRDELLGLHWHDIDFDEECLYVRRSVSRIAKYGIVVSQPKTKTSRRKIALPAFVLEALKAHKEHQAVLREKAGARWQNNDIVFCNIYGGYLSETRLQSNFKKLLKSAELPNVRFHDLRHSAASFFAKLGVHPKVVQEILGHSDISMTMNVYSHAFPSMQEEAMNKLDEVFKRED